MSMPFISNKPRVRTLLQSEQQECGLACMAMIANAYGHNIDLPTCGRSTGSSKAG